MLSKKYIFILNKSVIQSNALRKQFAFNVSSKASVVKKDEQKEGANKTIRLFASVCVERMPVITCDMNDLEKRYSNLINEINIRNSYLSSHELRHKADLERLKKKKKAESVGEADEDLLIETALDYEEKCLKKLNSVKFAERKLSTDYDKRKASKESGESNKPNAELQNVDYILDKKLILLVNEPNTSTWQLPKIEWSLTDKSLRQSAERIISNLNSKLEVEFLGNAPCAVYKNEKDERFTEKCYFFKAQYKNGAQFLASSKSDFVWIRKNELKDFINDPNYLQCLSNFILDF